MHSPEGVRARGCLSREYMYVPALRGDEGRNVLGTCEGRHGYGTKTTTVVVIVCIVGKRCARAELEQSKYGHVSAPAAQAKKSLGPLAGLSSRLWSRIACG